MKRDLARPARLALSVVEGGAVERDGLEATMSPLVAQRLALIDLLGTGSDRRRRPTTRVQQRAGRKPIEWVRVARCRP